MASRIGNAAQVIDAFVDGRALMTAAARVPGGRRVTSTGTELYSYSTVVAVRDADGTIATTTRRYSVTTSKLVGRVERAVAASGRRPATGARVVRAAVPGRWGGFGPAWHPTGWEDIPFVPWAVAG